MVQKIPTIAIFDKFYFSYKPLATHKEGGRFFSGSSKWQYQTVPRPSKNANFFVFCINSLTLKLIGFTQYYAM
jgi:hypothetical protein